MTAAAGLYLMCRISELDLAQAAGTARRSRSPETVTAQTAYIAKYTAM